MGMREPWKINVDLDGTLCESTSPDRYAYAKPKVDEIAKCNKLHEMGHFIQIYTARSWAMYDLTIRWLLQNGVKFDILVCGKLLGHANIDDMNCTFEELIERLSK